MVSLDLNTFPYVGFAQAGFGIPLVDVTNGEFQSVFEVFWLSLENMGSLRESCGLFPVAEYLN